MDTMRDVFTKDGEYLGTRPASVLEGDDVGFYFKTVRVILLNENNEILIQKRSNNKKIYPGKWEISASGHVEQGENEIDAAIRETKEEVGVSLSKENIRLINTTTFKNALSYTYISRIKNSTEFTLEENEVDEVKYVSLYEFKKLLYSDEFVNKGNEYNEFLLNYLINVLKIDDRDIIKREVNTDNFSKSMESINNDENVKEGQELDSSLKVIDYVIAILLLILVGIVIYCIIKL